MVGSILRPNQWVDPMGLTGEKRGNDRGLFWLTDEAVIQNRKESEKNYQSTNKETKSNMEWLYSDGGFPKQPVPKVDFTLPSKDYANDSNPWGGDGGTRKIWNQSKSSILFRWNNGSKSRN